MKYYQPRAVMRSFIRGMTLFFVALLLASCASTYEIDSSLRESIQWYTGETGQVSDVQAKTLLEKAVSTQDPLAVMWLARVHSTGRMGYPADKEKAQDIAATVIAQVERLAQQEVPEANFLMGTAYAEGLGKSEDPEEAVRWYRRAAALGNVLAQHNLGNVYASGTGVEQSDELAVQWWLQAATQGDAIPQYRLGLMYEEGKGVTKNLEEARRWYQESANRGNAQAQAALIRMSRQ